MSVRQDKTNHAGGSPLLELEAASSIAEPLGEGNSFAVAQSDNPLKRIVAVSIKASLNELCLQKARGTWAPSQEALRNIFQQVSRVHGPPCATCHALYLVKNPCRSTRAGQPSHIARLPTGRPCACPSAEKVHVA